MLRSSIITSKNQRNNSSGKSLENPAPTFPSKENNNDTKEHVPPIKDDVIDFCIDDTIINIDNTKKEKQLKKSTGGNQH